MTSLLFRASTAPEFPRPRKTYGSMYTDLVRASSDAVDALSLYRTLILAKDTSADSVGFTAFDAHVGDTSCQLRAAMMLDLTRQHRKWAASSGRAPWLDQYIERLEFLRDKARDMLAKLTIDRIHPEKLGIGPREDTPTGLLIHMGWCEPEIPHHPETLYLRPSTPTKISNDVLVLDEKDWEIPLSGDGCITTWTLMDKPIASSPAQYAWWQIGNNSMHQISPMVSCTSLSEDTLAEEVETPLENSPDKYLSPLLDGQDTSIAWDPLNAKMLVRFITFSFVLSKYKAFHRFKHAVGTRLSPEAAINAGDEMVHDVWKKRPLDDYLYSKSPRRIYIEFGAMQTWVSELSCAWLCHTAKTSSAAPGLQLLMTRTLQTSVKNVTSIPAYIGYLAIREHCGKERESLIFVDRHFCNKGYHSNFFLATLDLESANSGDEKGRSEQCLPLKQDVGWTVKNIDEAWLLNHPEQDRVHFIVMGNSIDGSYEDYMNAARTQQKHIEEPCDENENHVANFLAGDLDRLSLAFFARHRHYTFDLNSVGDDDEILHERMVVAGHMDKVFPELANQWRISDGEADEIGVAGTSLHMFAWQHAFVETKGRIAALISEATHTMPISARLEKLPRLGKKGLYMNGLETGLPLL